MKRIHRVLALLMAALMAIGLMTTAFAAEPTIDTSKKASLSIYKYDITKASEDGVWDAESYVSTGLHDDAVIDNVIIDGEIAVEYLFLRTKQINDDGTMIVTNDEQDNFNFRVTLSLRYTTSTFSFAVSILNHSNADSLRYRQFLKKAMAAKSIVLKSLKHNTIIAASKSPLMPDNCAKIDLEIDFLQKVVTIESYFHKVLIIPDEIELSDHKTINYLYAMIVEGKYCGVCGGFSMTFNVTDELRQMLYDLDGTTNVFYCNIGMSIELFNQILDFQITREIKGMRLEDSEKAKKKLDVLDNGEPIVIPFVSDVLDADIHYCDMFYFEKAET